MIQLLLIAAFMPQTGAPNSSSDVLTPAMVAKLDAVFAKPVMAPYRADYLKHRDKAIEVKVTDRFTSFQSYDLIVGFFRRTDQLRLLRWGDYQPIVGEPLPRARLIETADSAIEQLGEVPRRDRRITFENNQLRVLARRVVYGLPVQDPFAVTINAVTGALIEFSYNEPILTEPHGGDPVMADTPLREIGYSQLLRAKPPFEQAELIVDETFIDRSDTASNRTGIPIRIMHWRAPDWSQYYLMIDARDGRVIGGRFDRPQSAVSTAVAPVPLRLKVDQSEGLLKALGQTTATPPEATVVLSGGKTAFFGRFDAKQGVLWLRAKRDEPYQAFRPEAKLLKALKAQIRRTREVIKKR